MNKNYLIISDDKLTINNIIDKIIKKIKIDNLDVIKYDYQEVSIDKLLEELNTYNFLANTKLVIYYNCNFLSNDIDKSIKELKKYLECSSDNYLIMINDKLSDKKEIKDLTNSLEILKDDITSEEIIKNNIDNYKIDNNTIKYLVNYCLNNNEKILNELEKIKSYKYSENEKNISIDDINKIVVRSYDDDIFDLVNAITRKNKNKAFELYYRISEKEKDSVNIIASVSGGIRNLYSVKILSEDKHSNAEIAEILKIKPYAVSIALENCYNYSSKKLLYLLNTLSDIDYKTKSGTGQAKTLFELFLLSL